jgi:uncharacterized membrane protein YbaN (DUF454 family)
VPIVRIAWQLVGFAALACAVAGTVLPLVPTTPFLLIAAYAFARSSPLLHRWLVTHPRFGPLIRNWQAHGAINLKTKVAALLVMAATLGLSMAIGVGTFVLLLQAVVLGAAALFVATRPLPPEEDR